MTRDDQGHFHEYRAVGREADIFENTLFSQLPGRDGIAQNRYSTEGPKEKDNTRDQGPFLSHTSLGEVAVAHNGNLTNARELRRKLSATGAIFATQTDTEVIQHLIARAEGSTLVDRLKRALPQLQGAYAFLFLSRRSEERLIAVQDPYAIRPLTIGHTREGVWYVASETCALDALGATGSRRDLRPGEMAIFGKDRVRFEQLPARERRFCIFEYIYFSCPDSVLEGDVSVYAARKRMGQYLAECYPVEADIVVPVPDSGVPAALGYAERSGIPYELGLIRSHHIGRTFIEPTKEQNDLALLLKHRASAAVLSGKRVVLVDDSIVKGNTSRKIIQKVRDAGAKEVHLRISSPPTTHSCFYGIDTPDRRKLIAAGRSVEEIAKLLGVNSLGYLTLEDVRRAIRGSSEQTKLLDRGYCDACFTGEYFHEAA